jgi:transposase
VGSDPLCALGWLARYDQIDWTRAVVDSCSIRAVYGDQTGPNPTDRAKRGSKRHLICDGRGVPLAVRLTGANRNDSQEASRRWMRFRRCSGNGGDRGSGRPVCSGIAATTRLRFVADCGRVTSCRGSSCVAPRTGVDWAGGAVVERTFAWFNQFRRLRVQYDKRADIHEAFLSLGCALICWQSLRRTWR